MIKEGGADVVKLEGAGRMLSRVRAIAESNIGIMGHVGLTPQSATKLGGFKAQGRTAGAAKQLYDDALALQEAGAFAIVLEAVPAPVAARVTEALQVPTIGIGAGAGTDGQVLVWHDMLGMYAGRTPRFVKRYAEIADEIGDAVAAVRGRTCARGRSRRRSTPTASRRRSSSGSRQPSERAERDDEQDRDRRSRARSPRRSAPTSSRARRARRSRAARPTSARKARNSAVKTWAPAPLSRPPLRNTSSP